jgi:hypothetical protein
MSSMRAGEFTMGGAMMNRGLATIAVLAVIAGLALGGCDGSKTGAEAGVGIDAPADRRMGFDLATDWGLDLDARADVVDAADDRPALSGVTCVTRQSFPRDGGFCTQTLVTEPDVGFWRAMINLEAHWDAALGTDSAGMHLFFGYDLVERRPLFFATDDTFTLYQTRDTVAGMDTGTVRRTGERLDFTMNARSGDVADGGCSVPSLEITCSGSTWLRR